MPANGHIGQNENVRANPAIPLNSNRPSFCGLLQLYGNLYIVITVAVVSDHDMGPNQDIVLKDDTLSRPNNIVTSDMNIVANPNNTTLRV